MKEQKPSASNRLPRTMFRGGFLALVIPVVVCVGGIVLQVIVNSAEMILWDIINEPLQFEEMLVPALVTLLIFMISLRIILQAYSGASRSIFAEPPANEMPAIQKRQQTHIPHLIFSTIKSGVKIVVTIGSVILTGFILWKYISGIILKVDDVLYLPILYICGAFVLIQIGITAYLVRGRFQSIHRYWRLRQEHNRLASAIRLEDSEGSEGIDEISFPNRPTENHTSSQ